MLVVSVLAVDAAAIAVYYLSGLDQAGTRTRIVFTIVWTVATLLVVLLGLTRIRATRLRARRRAAPTPPTDART